ncbi:hypothetical protein A5765_18920 [Mycolicibacterium celeriflavum]|uniref:hypothetical protein n=1 Tax=Mycolicibacterium celeriflavum TaxID=1249101 RepID=UPI00080200B5|nr:hypothetical protein [Mycolicibacterium celeriflavum]OBG23506.1 hypothetical protein A5765_18920 [Mycolicibacterium celeriflavum]
MLAPIESRIRAIIQASAAASLGFVQRLTGTQPDASQAADARRSATHHHDQEASVARGRDTKLEHQERADTAAPAATDE